MAFIPVQMTNDIEVRVAETVDEYVQLQFDGWWAIGVAAPPLTLTERFVFGPTAPSNPRPGTIYFATPV